MDLPFLKRVTLQQEICPRAERSDNKLRTFVSASPSAMAISASRTWPCFLMCSKIGDVFMAEGDAPFAEVVMSHLERRGLLRECECDACASCQRYSDGNCPGGASIKTAVMKEDSAWMRIQKPNSNGTT